MNSCHTDGSICPFFGTSSNHCGTKIPVGVGAASIIDKTVYPKLDYGNYNISERPRDALMYGGGVESQWPPVSYTSQSGADDAGAANCGKYIQSNGGCSTVFDYIPGGLSFEEMQSDTWFAYLFDCGVNGGNIGTPCYKIEDETRTTTVGASNPDPEAEDSETSGTKCIECPDFYCTPARMTCSYSGPDEDETNDPDCPYPTVFAIATDSNKIVVKYDQLSSTLPDGVQDLNLVYTPDGIDVDAWDANTYAGDFVDISHNPWVDGDEGFSTFVIYEGDILESGNKQGLRVKVQITPIIDPNSPTVVFTGTRLKLLELISGGQNYAVNDTFNLEYYHRHPNGSSSTLSFAIKVTQVGPVQTISGIEGFDVLIEGDTINGHSVTRAFHTDVENFPYHIIYVDGNGADFTADGQYTSSRNHVVTVVAGYGIKTRAFFGGYYEFLQKSIQYVAHDVDALAPDVYNTVIQPQIRVTVNSDGAVSGATILDGGQNWDTLPEAPKLDITSPTIVEATEDIAAGYNILATLDLNSVYYGDQLYGPDDPLGVLSYYYPSPQVGDAVIDSPSEDLWVYDAVNGWVLIGNLTKIPSTTAVKAQVEGVFVNGSLVSVNIINGGLGYSQKYPPEIYVHNYLRVENPVYFEGVNEDEDGIRNSYNQIKDAGTFPEYFAAYEQNPDVVESESTRLSAYEPSSIREPQSNTNVALDSNRRRILDLPQRRYRKSETDKLKELNTTYNMPLDENANIDSNYREKTNQSKDTINQNIDLQASNLTQELVPDQANYVEVLVESSQRRFSNLPQASRLTKYFVRQYNPDSRDEITLNVVLGCEQEEDGCDHIECATLYTETPPSSTVDPETGDETSFSYLLYPQVIGPGCKSWSISGNMLIRHNYTRSTNTYASAIEAYGNPFDYYAGA